MSESINRRKRDRSTPESELRYRQNKRILNEGFNSLSLNRYTSITDVDYGNGSADEECSPPPNASMNRTNRTPRSSRRGSQQSNETDEDAKPVEEEYMLSVIKGGQKKYLRKVDFLVDELIRKSARYDIARKFCPEEFNSRIPASVGPSPTADHALTNPFWLVSYLENGGKVDLKSLALAEATNMKSPDEKKPCTHAGDTTHTDWGIIEVPQSSSSRNPFKSPETHEHYKRSYYSGETNSSCESMDGLVHSASSAYSVSDVNSSNNNNYNLNGTNQYTPKNIGTHLVLNSVIHNSSENGGFKHIRHDDLYSSGESDSDAMQHDGPDGLRFDLDNEDLDDDQASLEAQPTVSQHRSRANSFESNYSDVSALSDISRGQNNPYYVDPDDNVYFMLDGNITETTHKRRPTTSQSAVSENGSTPIRETTHSHDGKHTRVEDEGVDDMVCDGESAGGYKYYQHRDLRSVVTNDAVFCID